MLIFLILCSQKTDRNTGETDGISRRSSAAAVPAVSEKRCVFRILRRSLPQAPGLLPFDFISAYYAILLHFHMEKSSDIIKIVLIP